MLHASRPGFDVLYVCWANQCRSPIAELLLHAAMRGNPRFEDAGWRVGSAGVAARTGRQIHPKAAQVLAERGVPSSGFTSRPLTTELVESADLILTAERAHRSDVVRLSPGSAHRAFTMRQFARLLTAANDRIDPAELSGHNLLVLAHDGRGSSQPSDMKDDDIADPIGGSILAFRRSVDQIADTLSAFGVATAIRSTRARWWQRHR